MFRRASPPAMRTRRRFTVPEPWQVPATSPDGAVVDYEVTAEDDTDPEPSFGCARPPGRRSRSATPPSSARRPTRAATSQPRRSPSMCAEPASRSTTCSTCSSDRRHPAERAAKPRRQARGRRDRARRRRHDRRMRQPQGVRGASPGAIGTQAHDGPRCGPHRARHSDTEGPRLSVGREPCVFPCRSAPLCSNASRASSPSPPGSRRPSRAWPAFCCSPHQCRPRSQASCC